MTDIDSAPKAAGWYPDPERVAASRFWDGSGWTEHTKGTAPLYAPPVAGTAVGPDPALAVPTPAFTTTASKNGIATAALVLGIVALLLDLLLVPTVLAIVFGAIGISRAGNRGGTGRARAIVAIALAVVALPVQAAIAIPVYIGVQDAARVAAIRADIENEALNSGVRLTDLACPSGLRPFAGEHFTCAATANGQHILVDVALGADARPTSISARRG